MPSAFGINLVVVLHGGWRIVSATPAERARGARVRQWEGAVVDGVWIPLIVALAGWVVDFGTDWE